MKKNYNVDWDETLAAPMSAAVPSALGGLRLDQALVQLFPQYSRNRLQAWLKSGHITVDGRRLTPNHAVSGGLSSGDIRRVPRRARRPGDSRRRGR